MKIKHGPIINYRLCNGCKACYDNCPLDVFGWDEERGQPTVAYADECWHCGICEIECPEQAIDVQLPLHTRHALGIY